MPDKENRSELEWRIFDLDEGLESEADPEETMLYTAIREDLFANAQDGAIPYEAIARRLAETGAISIAFEEDDAEDSGFFELDASGDRLLQLSELFAKLAAHYPGQQKAVKDPGQTWDDARTFTDINEEDTEE